MEQNEHGSDVARVRANIEAECEALTNLTLFLEQFLINQGYPVCEELRKAKNPFS